MAELSPLRRRISEDITIRNLSPAIQRSYVHAIAKFFRYFGSSPDWLGLKDIRAFQEPTPQEPRISRAID